MRGEPDASPVLMVNDRQIRYVGTSMNPWLLQNDILDWVPVSERFPVPGDVILFRDPAGSGRLIIHRVVRALPVEGYITRGDNCLHDDRFPVPQSAIMGIVTGGLRGEEHLGVPSGGSGRIYHFYAQQRRRALPVLQWLFFTPYHLISRHGVFCRLVPSRFRQRLVIVKTSEGYELQVYLGRHLAGWKGEQDVGWTILPPCRLFLDSAALPDSPIDLLGEV